MSLFIIRPLSIRSYDTDHYCNNYIRQILSQQSKVLTQLKIDSKDLCYLSDIQFPVLTHLVITEGYFYDGVDSPLEVIDAH